MQLCGKQVRDSSAVGDAWLVATVAVCDFEVRAKMVRSALKRKIVFFKEVPRISGLNLLRLVVDLRIAVRISVNEAAVGQERPRENRRSSQCYEMIDPGFSDFSPN